MLVWILLILAILISAYIRLAPSDPAQWHRPLDLPANADLPGAVVRIVEDADDQTLQRLHDRILATARTELLAGSPEDGHATYLTRSFLMGFPDYTTVHLVEGRLMIHGRLRFGRSDFGVNKRRVDRWLADL